LSVAAPEFVRWVRDEESTDELVNEAKYRAWSNGAEHAVLALETGERPMVRGGRDGIRFDVEGEGDELAVAVSIEGRKLRVIRIEWHTHPRVRGYPETYLLTGFDLRHIRDRRSERYSLRKTGNSFASANSNGT